MAEIEGLPEGAIVKPIQGLPEGAVVRPASFGFRFLYDRSASTNCAILFAE